MMAQTNKSITISKDGWVTRTEPEMARNDWKLERDGWCESEEKGNFGHKTKRPRLDLSHGTSVDQPSPKCCSRTL